MAEFCVKCWNKLNGMDYPPEYYAVSEDLELCEECGNYEHVIVGVKTTYNTIKPFLALFELIFWLFSGLFTAVRKLLSLFKKK